MSRTFRVAAVSALALLATSCRDADMPTAPRAPDTSPQLLGVASSSNDLLTFFQQVQWTGFGSVPYGVLETSVLAANDNRIYVVGGANLFLPQMAPRADAYVLSGVPMGISALPEPRKGGYLYSGWQGMPTYASGVRSDGQIGGDSWEWSINGDPTGIGAWRWRGFATPGGARAYAATARQPGTNGKTFVAGGIIPGGVVTNTVSVYDPSDDSWSSIAPMLQPRLRFSLVWAQDNKLYAFGSGLSPVNWAGNDPSVERWDPATNTWSFVANIPRPGYSLLAAAGANNRIYVTGPGRTAHAYDIATNSWRWLPPTFSDHAGGGAASTADGQMWFIGGTEGAQTSIGPTDRMFAGITPQDPVIALDFEGNLLTTGGVSGFGIDGNLYFQYDAGGAQGLAIRGENPALAGETVWNFHVFPSSGTEFWFRQAFFQHKRDPSGPVFWRMSIRRNVLGAPDVQIGSGTVPGSFQFNSAGVSGSAIPYDGEFIVSLKQRDWTGGLYFFDNLLIDGFSAPARPVPTISLATGGTTAQGQPVTAVATLSGPSPFLNGVRFTVDGALVASNVPVINGVATAPPYSLLSLGTHTFKAEYPSSTSIIDPNYRAGSATATHQVLPSTTTQLSTSGAQAVIGQPITLTATVQPALVGSVHFFDGSNLIATVTSLPTGVATTTLTLPLGSHSISAKFLGVANAYAGSQSSAITHTVSKASVSMARNSTSTPALYGTDVIYAATIAATPPGAGVVTGTISFFRNDVLYQANVPISNGQAFGPKLTNLPVGTHTFRFTYSGDANFNSATSADFTHVIVARTTMTSQVSSANPSTFGQAVTLTASVSGGVNPTGNVKFSEGSNLLATVPLAGDGTARFDLGAFYAVGTHSIVVTYSGDDNHAGSSVNHDQTIEQRGTATTATTGGSVTFGEAVTVDVHVAALGSTGIPGGSVTLSDADRVVGTVQLDASGNARFAATGLSVGSHNFFVSYSGDANYLGSSTTVSEIVMKAGTSTSLVSDHPFAAFSAPVRFTAQVSTQRSDATGILEFVIDGAKVASVSLGSDGRASYSTDALGVGDHIVSARYLGDDSHISSNSPEIPQSIDRKPTSMQASGLFGVAGAQLAVSAGVISPFQGVPTGSVTVAPPVESGVAAQTAQLGAVASATMTFNFPKAGVYTADISYAGDAMFAPSTGTATITVAPAATSIVLESARNPQHLGDPVTLTAVLSRVSQPAGPISGTLTYTIDGGESQSVAADANGLATIEPSGLALGSHLIEVSYAGSSANAPASASINQFISNSQPTANAGGPYSGNVGAPVALSCVGADPDLDALTYAWDFGDGASSAQQHASHSYSAAGSYEAKCTVTDSHGAFASSTATVTVTANTAPTPAQETEKIGDTIDKLVSGGAIPSSVGGPLNTSIDAAVASLEKGNKTAASGQLNAFINKVEQMVKTKKMTAAQGAALIAAAQGVLATIQ
jgi:PKD repeat protein